MRKSRLTNEQLDLIGKTYRHNASDDSSMTWPENSDKYREAQQSMAEIVEELLDRRRQAGE